jgi:cell division protein ZapA
MAQVSLRINGYGYILGCADGEEDHLLALAADLDRRIDEIKVSTGPSGEARLLLMAALVLSDELHDLRKQTEQPPEQRDTGDKSEAKAGRRLRGIAKRAETMAAAAEAPEQPAIPDATPQPREDAAGSRPRPGVERPPVDPEPESIAATANRT